MNLEFGPFLLDFFAADFRFGRKLHDAMDPVWHKRNRISKNFDQIKSNYFAFVDEHQFHAKCICHSSGKWLNILKWLNVFNSNRYCVRVLDQTSKFGRNNSCFHFFIFCWIVFAFSFSLPKFMKPFAHFFFLWFFFFAKHQIAIKSILLWAENRIIYAKWNQIIEIDMVAIQIVPKLQCSNGLFMNRLHIILFLVFECISLTENVSPTLPHNLFECFAHCTPYHPPLSIHNHEHNIIYKSTYEIWNTG